MRRVYVAGAYSGPDVITILGNMRRGMRKGVEVLLAGYAPFVPWLDFHFQLMLRDGEQLDVGDYYRYGLAWLDASEAVLVLGNSENSIGTQMEIARAVKLGIPIFHSIAEMDGHFGKQRL
jgi:hypothetical protein